MKYLVKNYIWLLVMPAVILFWGGSGMMATGVFWIELLFVASYKLAFIE